MNAPAAAPSLIQSIYLSSAVELFTEAQLVELLRKSGANNERHGVSGMLLYQGGNFIQVLEGPVEAVDRVLARVAKDPRHRGVIVMSRRPVAEREFGEWSMGFATMTADEIAGFSGFMRILPTAPDPEDSRRAHKMLAGFRSRMR